MTIAEYAIKRRVTTVMVFVGIFFLGAVSLVGFPQELFPRITFPQITVVTDYANAAPEEIETLITRPLEEAISSVAGLRRIESVSREGKSMITVAFNWNQDIDFAALAVREKIDLVKERLPKESEDPVVLKFDPLSRPVLILSVTGKLQPAELKRIATHTLQDNLEKVEGVASVTVSGGLDREIVAELDQGRMQAAGVSVLEVIDAIDTANISYPAGSIKKGLYEYLIRTVGEFRSVDEIGFAIMRTDVRKEMEGPEPSGFVERGSRGPRQTLDTKREEMASNILEKRMVVLNDIAEIKDTFRERTSVSRYNGHENVSLSIQKQASANAVDSAEHIKRELALLNDEVLSQGAQVEIVYDHSDFIKKAVQSTRDAAVQGAILAIMVLLPFFRDWGSSLIVALSIPISVIGTFFLLKIQGITLNTMSLGGLALGSGMIVDNSIVVIENIFRLREQGYSKEDAAVQGTNEVFWPIVASTLTTKAVFLPLILFVPGVAGQLFRDLSWAVIYSLSISFLVSIWLIPMASLYIHPKKSGAQITAHLKKVQEYFKKKTLKSQNRIFSSIIGVGVASFLVALVIFKSLDTEVLPKIDQGQFLVKIDLPVGSRIEVTDSLVTAIEEKLHALPEVDSVAVTIGSASSSKVGEVKVDSLRSSQGIILVSLKKKRKRPSGAVVQELKKSLEGQNLNGADVQYLLQENEFEFATAGGKPIVVEIKGYDLGMLKSLAEEAEGRLHNVQGVMDITDDIGQASPETKIQIDKKKSSLYAISARDISLTAKAAIDGAVATEYKEGGKEIDVRVRLKESDRTNVDKLNDLLLYSTHLTVAVPLKAIATIKQGYGPSEIKRKDQLRTVTVAAAIMRGYKEKDVLKKVGETIHTMEFPKAYDVKMLGKAKEVKESFSRVTFAIFLALALNYMIMAAQFESFIQPLIIMCTVPLAMIGVALALLVTHTAISVISLLGVMILAGTVVNNAIVLIDFLNQSRLQGAELVQAAIESAFVRARPIIMSALTAVLGLIPLALGIGEGAELQAPLAIAMIGGLLTATFFTLCVIPAVYILVVRVSDYMIGFSEGEEII